MQERNVSNYIASAKGRTFIGKVINRCSMGLYYRIKAKIFSKKMG